MTTAQPTIRAINRHLFYGQGYCYIRGADYCFRIACARTRDGVREGRFVNGSRPENARVYTEKATGLEWVSIPPDARIELE